MLRLMREKAGNWLIKILLGAIVIVFVFWGVGSIRNQDGGKVALVNGEPITVEEYRKAYNDLMEQLRQSFGKNLNDEMLKMLNVRKQALDRVIDKRLLLSEASKLNFRVSEKELAGTIKKIGAFQRAGVFNNRLYQAVLNQNRLSPEQFEVLQSELILVEKLRLFITGSTKVSDKEAREWYNWSNTSINIDFVLFEPGRYKNINPSPGEITAYYDTHKSAYKTEPLVKVRYLHFKPETYTARVTVAEEEIRDYYEANPEKFNTPKTVEARHILIKVAQDAGPEAVERARIKSLAIHKMAKEGKDFGELAKQFSEGPSKDKGGYLGTFKRETMVTPFADKAFSMKAGEVSEPVRSPFGWHIIKVENVNKAIARSFEESTAEIREKMTNGHARNLAYDEAEAIYDVSFEGDDLVKAAKSRNLKILTTDFFSRKGPDKGITNRTKFASAAISLPVMEISDIEDLGDGYYILQVIEKIPEKIPELNTVEKRVRADLVKDKQEEKAKKDADEFLSALKSGESMSKATEKFSVTPAVSGFFKRNDSIPNIGPEREIVQTAFKLSNEKRSPDSAIKGEKGYYVIRLKERQTPDPKGFGKEQAKIRASLLQQKKSRAFEEYLAQIKKRSEISIEEGFLN